MKLVKLFNKLSAVALAASLVVGFASCSTTTDDPFNPNAPLTLEEYVKSEIKKAIENGGAQAKPEDPSKPGKPSGSLKEPKSLEFHVNADSTNAENTMIFVKYDRSAYGAEEEVKVTDAELNLYINDVKVKTYNEIVFVLDEYGAEITSRGGQIEDPKARKEYKAKLSVGKAVKSGETVKIELVKASVVKVGAASGKITLADLQFALIDTDPSVDYYKELAPNAEQFQNICTLEDLTTGEDTESKPGEEQKPGEKPAVKSIKLIKNEYAQDPQTQVKIPSELTSLSVGDKVKVAFSGTADREIGNVELMIVDTTKEAGYWTALSETKKDNFSTDINFDFEFVITKAPIGTGADSMVLAINGLDSDEAATIKCTSFSIEKIANEKPAGGENNNGAANELTSIWSGSCELDWSKGDANGDTISKEKFTNKTIGLQFTFTTAEGTDGDLQVMAQALWTSQVASRLEGDVKTDSENEVNYKLKAGITDGKAKIFFEGDALNALVTNGIKFFGNAATITKVELLETSE